MDARILADPNQAASITRAASKQTYLTIRTLVDKDRIEDAYRAYAYFRWVDDWIDCRVCPKAERLAFIKHQQRLVDDCYRGVPLSGLAPEECLLADLVQQDRDQNSGLYIYIRNMMHVMAFDANRRGRIINQAELDSYIYWLASSVTEALHYFIGHDCASPQDPMRYVAVTGAHITHMLRDMREDVELGYYNLPREVAAAGRMAPWNFDSPAYLLWVEERVRAARACFRTGRAYLARVENLRCRIAGYAYIRRFEVVLDAIQHDHYLLRVQYPERKSLRRRGEMVAWALWMAFRDHQSYPVSAVDQVG